jgi:hypothetical protein
MTTPFRGTIGIDVRDSVPDWGPYTQPRAPEGHRDDEARVTSWHAPALWGLVSG